MSEPLSDSQLDALFAQARARRPKTSRVEYAFETRLLARLKEVPRPAWGLVAWRMIPVFALVVLALGFWQMQVSFASNEAAQTAMVENPEGAELLASFN